MNKVVNINLNGFIFSIDEQAYDTLKKYIDALRSHFANTESSAEIISDIESRIAELLQRRLTATNQVILQPDVEQVIELMGKPFEIGGEEDSNNTYRTAENTYQAPTNKKLRRNTQRKVIGGVCSGVADYMGMDAALFRVLMVISLFFFGSGVLLYIILWIAIPAAKPGEVSTEFDNRHKRLFRNPDDMKIGGVCSGLGAYLGIDAVWLRLAFLIAFFVFGSGFLLYIILWIAIPIALTASDKLNMKGENIDVSSIEREFRKSSTQSRQSGYANNFGRAGNMLSEMLGMVFNVIAKIIGAVSLLMAISILVFIICYQIGSFTTVYHILEKLDVTGYSKYFSWGAICFLTAWAALFMMTALKLLFSLRFRTRILSACIAILMLTGVVSMVYFGAKYASSIQENESVKEMADQFVCPDTLYIDAASLDGFDDAKKLQVSTGHRYSRKRYTFFYSKDYEWMFEAVDLIIKKSLNDTATIELKKTAHGEDDEDARKHAKNIQYHAIRSGNRLTLDPGIVLQKNQPLKLQSVQTRIKVPVGTILKLDAEVLEMLNRATDEEFDLGEVFMMTDKGLVCIDCKDDENWSNDEEESEDIEINLGGTDEDLDNIGDVHVKIGTDKNSGNKKEEKIEITTTKDGKVIKKKVKKIGPITITSAEENKKETK